MEDTLVALNTGYWRMRDGTLIERAKGKAFVIHPQWRGKLEQITNLIEDIRRRFQQMFGLNEMLFRLQVPHQLRHRDIDMLMEDFRHDRNLGDWMDKQRQEAIKIMNSLLEEIGMQPLRGLREH